MIGKSLLTLNPGVIEEGIFGIFKNVVETGIPNQRIHHYVHEQFDGWFHQTTVKQGDGVTTTTKDITNIREAEERLKVLETLARRESFEQTLEAVEEERQRIAESLHNGVGQLLFAIKLSLINFRKQKNERMKFDLLSQAESLLTNAIEETRLISHQLIPVHLQQFGLVKSIKQICNQVKNHVRFNVRVFGNPNIVSKQLSIVLYRIAQELITNVAKHSGCTLCTIHLKTSQEYVVFKIHDNGNGMYVPESRKNGIGLLSTISKVELLNGRIDINAVKGEGMTIKIKIPLR